MKLCNVPGCQYQAWSASHTAYDTCFMHTPPREHIVRRVWRAICANPRSSLDDLHIATGYSRSVCNRARAELIRRGAVSHEPNRKRTMRVTAANYQGHAYRMLWFEGD